MGLRLIFSIAFVVFLSSLIFPQKSHAVYGVKTVIEVNNAWVRYNPMAGRASAAYMDIKNLGDVADTIIAVNIAPPAHAMMHQTITSGGISKMLHLESADIAAFKTISFKPRGAHIMLMNMPTNLEINSHIILELVFSSGKKFEAKFKLCPITSAKIC